MSLDLEVIDTIECAATAMERLEGICKAAQASKQAASDRVPTTTNTLISSGLCDESDRAQLGRTLSDHAATLELLTKLAELHNSEMNKQASSSNGRAVGHAVSPDDGDVQSYGGVKTGRMTPADRAYYRELGITVPADA